MEANPLVKDPNPLVTDANPSNATAQCSTANGTRCWMPKTKEKNRAKTKQAT